MEGITTLGLFFSFRIQRHREIPVCLVEVVFHLVLPFTGHELAVERPLPSFFKESSSSSSSSQDEDQLIEQALERALARSLGSLPSSSPYSCSVV